MLEWKEHNLQRIKVAFYGVGVIGSMLAKTIMEEKKAWIEIVGAIDIDQKKIGQDLGKLIGLDECGVAIRKEVKKTLEETNPDVILHTTSSYLEKTYPELRSLAECGVDIVSSCEELSYPYATNKKLAEDLDGIAKQNDVSILGTGINPGFLMDVLPIVLTSPCIAIKEIHVKRQMNAANRRIPFQKKIGAGMSVEDFDSAIKSKAISGHVGLFQSISMLADSLGWELDDILIEEPQPVVLSKDVKSDWIVVPSGRVTGATQSAFGLVQGKKIIDYQFKAHIGAEEEFDQVDIEGVPKVSFKSNPCVNGDYGTIAMLINMIPRVINAAPGLLTMRDLPLPSAARVRVPA
jgi:2,4-diaminopentanoate dehydrogenase